MDTWAQRRKRDARGITCKGRPVVPKSIGKLGCTGSKKWPGSKGHNQTKTKGLTGWTGAKETKRRLQAELRTDQDSVAKAAQRPLD